VPQKLLKKNESALAAAKVQWLKVNTAGAKAPHFSAVTSARLKSCPVTKPFPNNVFRKLIGA
jgi:hypothetical protein